MKSETKISVVIVDDHTIFRTGLRMILDSEPNIKVLDDCGSVEEAMKIISLKNPDIVLLDLNLDGKDGLDILPQISNISEKTNVIILTGKKDINLHYDCLKLGANGLVLKDNKSQILVEAILKVYNGELWFDPVLMGRMLVEIARPQSNNNFNSVTTKSGSLTNREREIIILVGEGLKNKAIAERLFISETTVRHHLTSIFSKLQITGRLELAIYAFKNDLIKTSSMSKYD